MKRRRNCGIYRILNQNNGKSYIGSAVNLSTRWREHSWQLNGGFHCNRHLQSAWKKHGSDAFVFVVLEEIEDELDLVKREQFYLDQFRTFDSAVGYNISPIAGSTLGVACSPEKAAKIGAANRGRKQTPDHIHAKSPWGRSPTEETRQILREKMQARGHKPSAEALAKAIAANTGRSPSERCIEAVRAAANRPEHHEHLRALNDKTRGVSTILTEEQIAALIADRAKGMSYVALGKKYGVSNVTCKNWCVRKGVETQHTPPAPDRHAPAPLSSHPDQLPLL
jgi:group I intron endonuclease